MERRRLAVICSHLRQVEPRPVLPPVRASGGPLVRQVIAASACRGSDDHGSSGADKGGCVFCRIVRGESPAFKLYEDDVCLCILDSKPLTLGHSLIIPKSHYASLDATPALVVAAMSSTIPFLSNAIMKATKCNSFNLLVNNGAAAGQVVFHTHLHIIPRKENDCLWTSESSLRKPLKLNQETVNLANYIRRQLPLPKCSDIGSESHEPKLDDNS